jgi:hypothetical protein
MSKIICVFSFLILFSCEKKETKCVLYYFEGDTFSTLIPLECEDIFDFPSLRQIDIDDHKLSSARSPDLAAIKLFQFLLYLIKLDFGRRFYTRAAVRFLLV